MKEWNEINEIKQSADINVSYREYENGEGSCEVKYEGTTYSLLKAISEVLKGMVSKNCDASKAEEMIDTLEKMTNDIKANVAMSFMTDRIEELANLLGVDLSDIDGDNDD